MTAQLCVLPESRHACSTAIQNIKYQSRPQERDSPASKWTFWYRAQAWTRNKDSPNALQNIERQYIKLTWIWQFACILKNGLHFFGEGVLQSLGTAQMLPLNLCILAPEMGLMPAGQKKETWILFQPGLTYWQPALSVSNRTSHTTVKGPLGWAYDKSPGRAFDLPGFASDAVRVCNMRLNTSPEVTSYSHHLNDSLLNTSNVLYFELQVDVCIPQTFSRKRATPHRFFCSTKKKYAKPVLVARDGVFF